MTSSPGPERLHPKPPQVMTTQTVSTRRRAPPTGRCRPWLRTRRVCRSRTPARRGSWRGRGAGGAPPDTGLLQRPAPACGRGSHAAELSCDKVTAARRRRLIRRPGGWGLPQPRARAGRRGLPWGGGQAPAAPTRLSLQVPLPFGPPRVTPILGAWSPPHQVRGSGGENHSIRLLFQSMGATAFLFCLLEVLLILK